LAEHGLDELVLTAEIKVIRSGFATTVAQARTLGAE